jgi:hypothetical protein
MTFFSEASVTSNSLVTRRPAAHVVTCMIARCQHIQYNLSMAQAADKLFQMRVSEEWLRALDDWRRAQIDLPSRAAAIRRLVAFGLRASEGDMQKALAAAPDPKAFADDLEFHAAYGEWRQQALKATR